MLARSLTIGVIHTQRAGLPRGWECVHGGDPPVCSCHAEDGAYWVNRGNGLAVIESVATELDGRRWHHVSVSRLGRAPSWDDMSLVHRLFIGEDVEAYQVHVPRRRHINIHPYCLHLWSCLDHPEGILPDFAQGGRTI